MEGPIGKIAEALTLMARNQSPEHAFAALVHDRTDVTVTTFDGRILDQTAPISIPEQRTHMLGMLAEVQKLNRRKVSMFKKQGYRSLKVIYRARTQKASVQMNFDDADAYAFDPAKKRGAYGVLIGDAFPNPAASMFRDPLPSGATPSELARLFMADHKAWNAFAYEQSQISDGKLGDSEARWDLGQSYDNLILRYCAPDKRYQSLAYGSEDKHDPVYETVQSEVIEGQVANVTTLFQNPKFEFLKNIYRYEFRRDGDRWLLVELWGCFDDGDYQCL